MRSASTDAKIRSESGSLSVVLPRVTPTGGNRVSLMSPGRVSVRPVFSFIHATSCGLYAFGSKVAATYVRNGSCRDER